MTQNNSQGAPAQQLTLAVSLNDEATFDNFYVTSDNRQLVSVLAAWPDWPDDFLYVYGPAGSGCSHLLQAICQQVTAAGQVAQYLPLTELLEYPANDMLDGMEHLDLLCLDDVHCLAGNDSWQEALFHLYNRVKQTPCKLLVAGHQAAAALPLALADLVSRLQWGVSFRMEEYSDEQLQGMLQLRAQRRGIILPDDAVHYMIQRATRTTGDLVRALDDLDKASLQEGRKLTIPFIKSVLNW